MTNRIIFGDYADHFKFPYLHEYSLRFESSIYSSKLIFQKQNLLAYKAAVCFKVHVTQNMFSVCPKTGLIQLSGAMQDQTSDSWYTQQVGLSQEVPLIQIIRIGKQTADLGQDCLENQTRRISGMQ